MQIKVLESELYDCWLLEKETGRLLKIETVWAEQYQDNWFLKLLYCDESKNSHGVVYWQAIYVPNVSFRKSIEAQNQRFELVPIKK